MSENLSNPNSSDMPKSAVSDAFKHFTLSAELQRRLEAEDGSAIDPDGSQVIKHAKILEFPTATFYEIPWGGKEGGKQTAASQVINELWLEKKNLEIFWEGKDLVHVKGILLTSENQRLIYLPRRFDTGTEVEVYVDEKTTKSTMRVKWKPSEAYVLGPNTRLRVKGGRIRFFCISLRSRKPKGGQGERGEEG